MTPAEIFRFLNVRPVQKAADDRVERGFASFGKEAKTPLEREVGKLKGEKIRERAAALAKERLAADDLDADGLARLTRAVRTAAAHELSGTPRAQPRRSLGKRSPPI